jgi:hypothetical protein
MANERKTPLSHVAFEREPDVEPERRTRRGMSRPAIERDRLTHGIGLVGSTEASLKELARTRKAQGVDAERLMVVEFTSWDRNARDVFEERFGATVVDDRIEKVDGVERATVMV